MVNAPTCSPLTYAGRESADRDHLGRGEESRQVLRNLLRFPGSTAREAGGGLARAQERLFAFVDSYLQSEAMDCLRPSEIRYFCSDCSIGVVLQDPADFLDPRTHRRVSLLRIAKVGAIELAGLASDALYQSGSLVPESLIACEALGKVVD